MPAYPRNRGYAANCVPPEPRVRRSRSYLSFECNDASQMLQSPSPRAKSVVFERLRNTLAPSESSKKTFGPGGLKSLGEPEPGPRSKRNRAQANRARGCKHFHISRQPSFLLPSGRRVRGRSLPRSVTSMLRARPPRPARSLPRLRFNVPRLRFNVATPLTPRTMAHASVPAQHVYQDARFATSREVLGSAFELFSVWAGALDVHIGICVALEQAMDQVHVADRACRHERSHHFGVQEIDPGQRGFDDHVAEILTKDPAILSPDTIHSIHLEWSERQLLVAPTRNREAGRHLPTWRALAGTSSARNCASDKRDECCRRRGRGASQGHANSVYDIFIPDSSHRDDGLYARRCKTDWPGYLESSHPIPQATETDGHRRFPVVFFFVYSSIFRSPRTGRVEPENRLRPPSPAKPDPTALRGTISQSGPGRGPKQIRSPNASLNPRARPKVHKRSLSAQVGS